MKISIFGTKSSAVWVQEDPEKIHLAYANGEKRMLDRGSALLVANESRYARFKAGHPSGYIEAFANLYADIAEEIYEFKKGRKSKSSKAEVTYVDSEVDRMRFLEAVADSAKKREWINIVY
jgi:predicted dehydrogenase